MSPTLTERFEMRLDAETIAAVDRFAEDGPRAEAVRQLVEIGLRAVEKPPLRFSPGEMLIIHVLCDLMRALKPKNLEFEPEFIQRALSEGHYWGLEWRYTGVFHDDIDSDALVKHVVDVLDMWHFIEEGYDSLTPAEKQQLEKDAEPFGKNPKFVGWDGNNETSYMSAARFLVRDMERFERFKKRDMNSHGPSVDTYERMLDVFRPMRSRLIGRSFSVTELTEILRARMHPSNRR